MKDKKVKVEVELTKCGQRILSAFESAGIDPSEAISSEIARRKKLLVQKAKKISPRVGAKCGVNR